MNIIEQEKHRLKRLHQMKIVLCKMPDEKELYIEYDWGRHYPDKVYGYINLFAYDYKIFTYDQLAYTLRAIRLMNPNITESKYSEVIDIITDPTNHFILFKPNANKLKKFLEDSESWDLEDLKVKTRPRKVIFNFNCVLDTREKLSIVGKLCGSGKRVTEEGIYESMVVLHYDYAEKITIQKLAKMLECTIRTIHRNMSDELRKEKELLNLELQYEKI